MNKVQILHKHQSNRIGEIQSRLRDEFRNLPSEEQVEMAKVTMELAGIAEYYLIGAGHESTNIDDPNVPHGPMQLYVLYAPQRAM